MKLHQLSPGPDPPDRVHAVVEIPRGSRNKIEYSPTLGVFRLDRVLYSSVHYPGDYGFIPGTLADDGDPGDIIVLTVEPTFTGALLEARPIGVLLMRDEHGQDEKILAMPSADPRTDAIMELSEVAAHQLREIEHFFAIYKELEGTTVKTFGWEGRDVAHDFIQRWIDAAAGRSGAASTG